jgi:hypothetical protein
MPTRRRRVGAQAWWALRKATFAPSFRKYLESSAPPQMESFVDLIGDQKGAEMRGIGNSAPGRTNLGTVLPEGCCAIRFALTFEIDVCLLQTRGRIRHTTEAKNLGGGHA